MLGQKYVDNYSQWIDYVEQYGGRYLESSDADEIIKFVAQHNGKNGADREEYFRYLAVSSADITCRFNYPNAGKIVLRDTIGLGDMQTLNLDLAMVKAVSSECDAAVIVKRPESNVGRFETYDSDIYNTLKESCTERGLDMNKWFFYAINHTNTPAYGNNLSCCEEIKHDIVYKMNLACADAYIVNVSDKNDVTERLLKPMLFKLKDNLPYLDRELEERVKREEEDMMRAYKALCNACLAAGNAQIDERGQIVSHDEAERKWASLRDGIIDLKLQYERKKDEPCSVPSFIVLI